MHIIAQINIFMGHNIRNFLYFEMNLLLTFTNMCSNLIHSNKIVKFIFFDIIVYNLTNKTIMALCIWIVLNFIFEQFFFIAVVSVTILTSQDVV